MTKYKISFITTICIICSIITSTICFANESNSAYLENVPIKESKETSEIIFDITEKDLNNAGFETGDSIDIIFSNGFVLQDMPYYNNDYNSEVGPLLILDKKTKNIVAKCNNGEKIWDSTSFDEITRGTFLLHEKGKFSQKMQELQYTDNQNDIPDEIYANFRNINAGNISDDILYRSSSSCDKTNNYANISDKLSENTKIKYIINLADDDKKIIKDIASDNFTYTYFLKIYNDNNVCMLNMNNDYKSKEFSNSLIDGLRAISENDGPYLIQSLDGNEKTGYVCMILEALAGATYEEIIDDYMKTYKNYYEIIEKNDKEKYKLIKQKYVDKMFDAIKENTIDKMIEYLYTFAPEESVMQPELSDMAKIYLQSIGMADSEIEYLKLKICN